MKFLLIALTLMNIAFAGQHGSGGNVCVPKDEYLTRSQMNGTRYQGERTFDEVKYSDMAFNSELSLGVPLLKGKKIHQLTLGPIFEGEMTDSIAAGHALDKLEALSHLDKNLSEAFIRMYHLMKDIHVSERHFMVSAEVGSHSSVYCKPGTLKAVIITRPNGLTYVSAPMWEKLPAETQEVLFIHETLRLAQLFAPWFQAVSNDELEKLTMQIYAGQLNDLQNSAFYNRFNVYHDEMKNLSQIEMESFLSSKEGKVRNALFDFKGELAFTLAIKGLEYRYYYNSKMGIPQDNKEYAFIKMIKADQRFINLMVDDLVRQFGLKGP